MPKDQDDTTLQAEVSFQRPLRKKLRRLLLLILVPIIAVCVAVGFWLQGARFISTENAYVKTNIAKLGQGQCRARPCAHESQKR